MGHLATGGRLPSVSVRNPDEAYGEVVDELVESEAYQQGRELDQLRQRTEEALRRARTMRTDADGKRAQADDELVAALSSVETWKRQGDMLTLIGPKSLRFRTTGN